MRLDSAPMVGEVHYYDPESGGQAKQNQAWPRMPCGLEAGGKHPGRASIRVVETGSMLAYIHSIHGALAYIMM